MTKNIIITRDKNTDLRLDEQFYAWFSVGKFKDVVLENNVWISKNEMVEGEHLDSYLIYIVMINLQHRLIFY